MLENSTIQFAGEMRSGRIHWGNSKKKGLSSRPHTGEKGGYSPATRQNERWFWGEKESVRVEVTS